MVGNVLFPFFNKQKFLLNLVSTTGIAGWESSFYFRLGIYLQPHFLHSNKSELQKQGVTSFPITPFFLAFFRLRSLLIVL